MPRRHQDTAYDAARTRQATRLWAARFGLHVPETLPLLEPGLRARDANEVADRLMCLHATAARDYGCNRDVVEGWLRRHSLWDRLTAEERDAVELDGQSAGAAIRRVEATWVLAWIVGLYPTMDLMRPMCPDDLVRYMPDLRIDDSAKRLRLSPRCTTELADALDQAYILHWNAVEASLAGGDLPQAPVLGRVEPRRRALEWTLGTEPWDEVRMDT